MPQLLKCLEEPGDSAARIYFRLKVADALWRISGVADHLLAMGLEAVRSPEHWLRWQGAGSLGELGSAGSAAIPQLRSLLEDETPICASFGSGVAGEDRGRSVIITLAATTASHNVSTSDLGRAGPVGLFVFIRQSHQCTARAGSRSPPPCHQPKQDTVRRPPFLRPTTRLSSGHLGCPAPFRLARHDF